MLLLRTEKLPDGPGWLHELKFDGYRALAIKSAGKVQLRSRNDKDFNGHYAAIVKALAAMPGDTVIDGVLGLTGSVTVCCRFADAAARRSSFVGWSAISREYYVLPSYVLNRIIVSVWSDVA